MSKSYVTIYASGDLTGATDTAAIRSAAASLAKWGVLELMEGDAAGFNVNEPVALNGVRIECRSLTDISWRGASLFGPMISLTGGEAGVRNLRLNCYHKCSGVRLQVPYGKPFEHLHIRDAVGGIECVDCWGSYGSDLRLFGCQGTAWKLYRCNTSDWRHIRMYDCEATSTPSIVSELGGHITMEHICVEGCRFGDSPWMHTDTYSGRIAGLRFEGNAINQSHIVIVGKSYCGQCVAIEDVSHSSANRPECLVECQGTASRVSVRRLMSMSLGKCVIKSRPGSLCKVKQSSVNVAAIA